MGTKNNKQDAAISSWRVTLITGIVVGIVAGILLVATNTLQIADVEFESTKAATAQSSTSLFEFDIGDWNNDKTLDLIAIKKNQTGSHSTEVHILSGGSNFQQFLVETGTALHETGDNFVFDVGDWNRDNVLDLIAVKKNQTGTKKTEVHILSGASNFQKFLLQTGTALVETGDNFEFQVGDWNNDKTLDLVAIKKSQTGTKKTEVHILSGASNFQKFLVQTGTALVETGDNFEFQVGDWNNDKTLDLVAIKKSQTGTKKTEVHILSGASNFQKFLLQTGTALVETGDNFEFQVGDWNNDKTLDLIAIKKNQTGSHSTEVHILSGGSNFQQFLVQTGTALAEIAPIVLIPSFSDIASVVQERAFVKEFGGGKSFVIKVSERAYQIAYETAMSQFAKINENIGGPFQAEFTPSNIVGTPANEIYSTFSYGPPFERKFVEVWYSYYINPTYDRIQARVNRATIGGRAASDAEKGTLELEANKGLIILWGVYHDFVVPLSISNDDVYLYVGSRLKN